MIINLKLSTKNICVDLLEKKINTDVIILLKRFNPDTIQIIDNMVAENTLEKWIKKNDIRLNNQLKI